jgi:SAM-dependent methyltransferase
MNIYRYPDVDDEVTVRFIGQSEPYEGYWDESERRALTHASQLLASALKGRDDVMALDAGCGPGRLLPWISTFAARITAVDPDKDRLAIAKASNSQLDNQSDVTYSAGPLGTLKEASYDLIVSSHIIQHLVTDDVTSFLKQLHRLMSPDGLLVLSYSRAAVGDDRYSVDRVQDEKVESRPIDKEQFNRIVRESESGSLPIHFIDPNYLVRLAKDLGFKELWRWSFHALDDLGDLDQYVHRDELVNSSPELSRELGRDAMVIWQRI